MGVCCCGPLLLFVNAFGAAPARTLPSRGTPVSGLCVPISAAGLQGKKPLVDRLM